VLWAKGSAEAHFFVEQIEAVAKILIYRSGVAHEAHSFSLEGFEAFFIREKYFNSEFHAGSLPLMVTYFLVIPHIAAARSRPSTRVRARSIRGVIRRVWGISQRYSAINQISVSRVIQD